MLVFPFIFGYPRWLYLLLFVAFIVAGMLFNRFLRHSLRNGPRWGKSSASAVRPSCRSPAARSRPASSPRSATVSAPSSFTTTSAPPTRAGSASSVRPHVVTSPPVSRFAYCRRYPDLLALCEGSVVRADRLVDLESKGSSSAAPDVWVNLAISRFSVR